jgi:hypothetical protein
MTRKFELSDNQVSTSLNEESIILNHQIGEYYQLNGMGTFIWNLLKDAPVSLESIFKLISENFEVDGTNYINDVQLLLEELVDNGLIIEKK